MQIRFFTFGGIIGALGLAGLLVFAAGCGDKEVAAKADQAQSAPADVRDEVTSDKHSQASGQHGKDESLAQSHSGQPPIHVPDLGKRDEGIRFDHRVLSREKANSFKVNWSKTIALTHSKYYFLKIELLFDLTDEAISKDFAGTAPTYPALSEKIEGVFAMCRTSDLQGAEAMEKRREELIETLNAYFGATVVRDVSYVEYRLGQR